MATRRSRQPRPGNTYKARKPKLISSPEIAVSTIVGTRFSVIVYRRNLEFLPPRGGVSANDAFPDRTGLAATGPSLLWR